MIGPGSEVPDGGRQAELQSRSLLIFGRDGASTVASGSGCIQASVVDGEEATKDGTAGTSSRGHTEVTTGTLGMMNVGANGVA